MQQQQEDEADLADFVEDDDFHAAAESEENWRAELRSVTGYDPSRCDATTLASR